MELERYAKLGAAVGYRKNAWIKNTEIMKTLALRMRNL